MLDKHNKDFVPPWADDYVENLVSIVGFKTLKIFWGPGQLTESFPTYNPPAVDSWRKLEHINIPQVVRFIYATESDYDTDKYNDDDSPPPPPPPPPPSGCVYDYVLTPSPNYFVPVDAFGQPFYDYYQVLTDGTKVALLSLIPYTKIIEVDEKFFGPTLYLGAVKDAPDPYIKTVHGRFIEWYQTCNGLPRQFMYSLFGSSPSDTTPPRCWVVATDGSITSEIPAGAHEQYGCGPSP